MAQTVEYTLKLNIDGQDHVVNLSSDVKRLAEDLGVSKEGSDELRKSLLKINNITQSFQNAAQGIQELTGTLLDLTGSYATQQINETRLANNMRNTMDARDEDIQSILDLCSAQQQLGVIGDEVQLAGAQELATYLEKKSSLEALIPVMNDMLAQQYGLEASEESAAQVASMLGKVMEGQTAALSRYGYSFTEAQEQILKFGTEEERAAVLAEVVESSVGGMNEALRQTPAGQAKAAADRLGDMKEAVGAIIARLEPGIVVVQNFAAAVDTVAKTATGIQGAARAFMTLSKAMRSVILGAPLVGVAIWAIIAAIDHFSTKADDAVESSERLARAEDAFKSRFAEADTAIKERISSLGELTSAKKDCTEAVRKLAEEYPTLVNAQMSGEEAYKALIAGSKQYCTQLAIEAKANALKAQLAEINAEKEIAYEKRRRLEAEGRHKQQKLGLGTKIGANGQQQLTVGMKTVDSDEYAALGQSLDALNAEEKRVQAELDATNGAADRLKSTISDTGSEGSEKLKVSAMNLEQVQAALEDNAKRGLSMTDPKELAELGKSNAALQARKKYLEELQGVGTKGNGKGDDKTRLSLIENAATYKDLANNVKYYEQQLEEANITDVETIQNLTKAKAAAEEAVEEFRKLTTVTKTDEQKREAELAELRASEVASLKHEEITTQEQLSAKMTYYNRLQQLGTEKDRLRAQEGIRELNAIAKAWDMVIDKQRFQLDATGEIDPSAIFNSEDIDAAIRFYTDRQQQEDADQVQKTQTLIDRLTERKTAIQLGIELPSMKKEADEIAALTGREYTIKVRSMGFDQIMAKIREIEELLDNPNITADQSQQLEQLIGIYAQFAKDSVRSLGTYKGAWSGIKGVGSGIESITQALEDNSNAWQKITALIDGFLQIADGISAIVTITNMLAEASQLHTAAKSTETAATIADAAAKGVETGMTETAAAAQVPAIAANKAAAASYLELAAAEYMAAHAYIPFAGYGIGAGFATAAKALVEGMGLMAFAGGGIVGGSSTTGDRLLVRVNSGEMILNKHQQLMLWQLLNGQRSSLSAAAIQYNVPQVSLDVPALQSQLRPYSQRVVVTGTLHGRGRDILATIETEQNHRKRA